MEKDFNFTKHFKYSEFWGSEEFPEWAFPPFNETTKNLLYLSSLNLETIRSINNVPIKINSGYRNFILNQKVGGTENSLHTLGCAVDFTVKNKVLLFNIYDYVKHNMEYSELFLYLDETGMPIFIHLGLPVWFKKKVYNIKG